MEFIKRLFKKKIISTLTLPKNKYCLVNDFHLKLSGDDRIFWLYWLDKNIALDLRPNVVIDLTNNEKSPKKYDLPCDVIALNLSAVFYCMGISKKELSQNNLLNIYRAIYR